MREIKGWRTTTVRDLCELGRGRVISGQEVEEHPGIYPVYSSQSKNNGEMGAIDTFDFDGEYVTWTTDGAYAGTVFYRSGKFNCTNVCGTLLAKDPELNLQFLAYKLATIAKNHVSYVGNPKLMNGIMASIELSLPESKDEQTQISAILFTLDRVIEQTEAIIAKQQRIKAGLMQDLLTKGIDEHGVIRSEATHQFKDSPLGQIPVEWDVVTVENLCSDIVDCPHTTPAYVPSGVPCIRTADMIPGQLLLDQAYCITEKDYRERVARLIPKKGDIIYSREGERLGIASPVGNERVCLGQRVMLLRPGCETDPDYLLWAMNSPAFYNRIVTGLGATTSPHINVGDIRKALILKPLPQEQEKIGQMLAAQSLHFRSETEQTVKYRKMKAGLMHDLLTGTVRVN